MSMDLGNLQVGQAVVVKESSFGVQLGLPAEHEPSLKVIEVSPEYLLLEDPAGSTLRLPFYLIHKTVYSTAPVEAPVPMETPRAA